jgi:hypothetical protein
MAAAAVKTASDTVKPAIANVTLLLIVGLLLF